MIQWHVEDVMTRNVISVSPDASYREVVDALVEHGVSAAPVVSETGEVLGIVSEADLLPRIETAGEEAPRGALRSSRHAGQKAHATHAAELMTAPPITIGPDATISAAARAMETSRVKRLPVVDAETRLLGIVSRQDLLRIFTRSDSQIHHDIVETVLRRDLWVDPSTLDVTVADGVVTVDGQVETRSLAGAIHRRIATVPGVVEVVDLLRWELDDSRAVHARGYLFGSPDQLMRPPPRWGA